MKKMKETLKSMMQHYVPQNRHQEVCRNRTIKYAQFNSIPLEKPKDTGKEVNKHGKNEK